MQPSKQTPLWRKQMAMGISLKQAAMGYVLSEKTEAMARNKGHVFGLDVDDRGNTPWILSNMGHGLHSRLYVAIQPNCVNPQNRKTAIQSPLLLTYFRARTAVSWLGS